MAAYQLYRNTTLGHTLQESIEELIQVTLTVTASDFDFQVKL